MTKRTTIRILAFRQQVSARKLKFLRTILGPAPIALLAACGGAGGQVASAPRPPAGVPAPAPAPSPGPAPAPAPSLVAEFPSASTPTYYSTSHVSSPVDAKLERFTDGTARVEAVAASTFDGTPSLGNFEYRGKDSYAVEFYGFGGPSFPASSKLASTAEFERFRTALQGGHFANLNLARLGAAGLDFTYSSLGNVLQSIDRPDHVEITFFALGSTTPASQMPRTGKANYSGIADGLWLDGPVTRRLYGSTAQLEADFARGELTSTLELRGRDDAFGNFGQAPSTLFGLFTGTAAISGSHFQGNYARTGGYAGTFSGQFFGPSAQEAGWAFRLTGAAGQTAFGAALAGR